MHTSPDGFHDMEAVLFLLSEFADLSEDQVLIEGGLRLDVFETAIAISRAQDFASLAGMQ